MTLGLDFPATLAAARVGADWAWTSLYRDLAPSVLRYLRAHAVDHPDDLLEEVFIRVVRGLPDFAGREDDFGTWVFTITHQRVVDERRRVSGHPDSPHGAEDLSTVEVEDLENESSDTLEDAHVCAIMARLTTGQREVLFLRIIAGLSIEQTARALGKTPNGIKALQIRGLQAISRHLALKVVPR